MKELTKRIIAVIAVLCVAATGLAGCSKDKKEESSASEEAMTKFPLQFGEAGDGNALTPGDPNYDLDAEDPVEPATEAKVEETTEIAVVTDDKGEPVTEVAEVTDAEGAKVTDDKGTQVTTVVEVTTIVKKPAETQPPATQGYTPKTDGRYAMWLDISKDENFYFEGDFLKASFKVKEGIPDGDYKIRISPDLSDIRGTVVRPSNVIDGTVRVNNGSIEAVDVSSESGLVFYGDNIACKQGDTIDYYFYVKNNSGLAAFCIWFYFDKNALEFISAAASGEFENVAKNTEVGAGKYNSELED